MRTILILASAAALTVVSAPSFAADSASRAVSYGDLNLASGAGQSAFKGRVRSAAIAVCGADQTQDLASRARARACVADAMTGSDAVVGRAIRDAHGA